MVGKAMQMARSPDRAPEPFYALFPSDCLIKKDLEGTCFRWDKPGGQGGCAAAVSAPARLPRARASRRPLRFQLLNVNLYQ